MQKNHGACQVFYFEQQKGIEGLPQAKYYSSLLSAFEVEHVRKKKQFLNHDFSLEARFSTSSMGYYRCALKQNVLLCLWKIIFKAFDNIQQIKQ